MSLRAAFFATLQQGWNTNFLLASNVAFPPALCQRLGTTSNTFEFWSLPTGNTSGQPYLYYTDPDDGNNRFHSHFPLGANGRFYFSCGNLGAGGQTSDIGLSTGPAWYNTPHHVAVVVSVEPGNTYMAVYLDGQAAYWQGAASTRAANNYVLRFLTDQGQAGNIRAWSYARTQAQLQADMRRLLSQPQAGLLLNVWGNERGPAGTSVRDRSGNNFHATTY